MGKHVTPKGVCNCPRGGNNEAVQIEVNDPEVGYRPTRIGAMRIEDVNGRTRPAEPSYPRGLIMSHPAWPPPLGPRDADTSSGSILTPVGQCPGTRPTMFGHVVCGAYGRMVDEPSPVVEPPPAPT